MNKYFDEDDIRIRLLKHISASTKKQMKKMIEPLKAQLQKLQSSEKSALEGRIVQNPCSSSSADEPSLTP